MLKHVPLAVVALLWALTTGASAQNLTEAQARAIIAPWYSLFNVATRGDVKSIQEQVLITNRAPDTFPVNAGAAIHRSRWSGILPTPSRT